MLAPHARKRGGSSTIFSKKFGDHVTIDHIVTKDLRDFGIEGEKVALVVKDVFTNFRYVYPSSTKAGEEVYESLLHYFKVDDEVGIVYSDNAPELESATSKFKVRHNTSRPYVDETKAVVEREIRTRLEGTRSNLCQAGLPDKMWPLAAQHHAMALNLSKRMDCAKIPWEDRFGESFSGLTIPFGAKILYWNNPKENATNASKFAPKGEEGIFLGYHIQPGFIWRQEYIVAPLKGSREAIENDDLRTLRVKRMELPIGDLVFPLAAPEDQGGEPPKLDDQECTFPPKDQGVLAVDGEMYTDGRDPLAPWDPSGIDLDEELAKLRQRSSEPIYVPDEEKPHPAKVCLVVLLAPREEEAQGHPPTNLIPTRSLNPASLVTTHIPCPTANPCLGL